MGIVDVDDENTEAVKRLEERLVHVLEEISVAVCDVDDRACILSGAAMIEGRLKKMIEARIPEDVKIDHGRVTLGSAILYAQMLALIPPEWKGHLTCIKKIRDHAAHDVLKARFSDPDIHRLCRSLIAHPDDPENARMAFQGTVQDYCVRFEATLAGTERLEFPTIVIGGRAHTLFSQIRNFLNFPVVATGIGPEENHDRRTVAHQLAEICIDQRNKLSAP